MESIHNANIYSINQTVKSLQTRPLLLNKSLHIYQVTERIYERIYACAKHWAKIIHRLRKIGKEFEDVEGNRSNLREKLC